LYGDRLRSCCRRAQLPALAASRSGSSTRRSTEETLGDSGGVAGFRNDETTCDNGATVTRVATKASAYIGSLAKTIRDSISQDILSKRGPKCEPIPGFPLGASTFSAIVPASFTDRALAEDEAADVELEVELLVVVLTDVAASIELEVRLLMVDGKTVLLIIIELEDQDWFWARD